MAEQIDLRGDGRLILYVREETARPVWQCRIRVPDSNAYKRISLKTVDRREAERKAYNEYESLYMHVKAGGTVHSKTFAQVFEEWEKNNPTSPHTARIRARPLPYFGKMRIDAIKESDFTSYWYERKAKGEVTNGTLKRERTAILPVFKYALAKGYIRELPNSVPPLKPEQNRRLTFSAQEWDTITKAIPSWIEADGIATTRDRAVAAYYFRILACTGIRVGEARQLKWSDLRLHQNYVVLKVTGKTGARETVANANSFIWFQMIKQYTGELEYLFAHADGTQIGSFKRAFGSLLKHAGIFRGTRTIYSLRHFYATDRLQHGVNPYHLAKQMGTSVEMLERFYGHVINTDMASHLTQVAK